MFDINLAIELELDHTEFMKWFEEEVDMFGFEIIKSFPNLPKY